MANIRKSFNFRNGVQVDNNNFVVSPNGLVGIGSSAPTTRLDVVGDVRSSGLVTSSTLGSGIGTITNFNATNASVGVLTATTLSVGSNSVTNLIGFAITTFITDSVGLHTISKLGISTNTANANYALDVGGNLRITGDTEITGITTSTKGFSGDLTGNVNATSGVSTFTQLKVGTAITMSAGIVTATKFEGAFTGDVTGTATTATNLANGANITTGTINDDRLPDIVTSNINILSGTSYFNKIGVNTTSPLSDIHIRKNIQTALQVTSNSNASLIGLGRSESITGFNGVLRYGNNDSAFSQYSGFGITSYSLDIMNYGPGNINFYLNPSEIAGTNGSFFWHKETSRLMALTGAGNLGIGITTPSYKLQVTGTAYVSGDVTFDNNLNLTNNLVLNTNGSIGIGSITPTEKLDVVGNITASGNITADGNLTVASISTTTGTSNQFLKADGSVDTSTYLTSALQNVEDDTTPKLGGDLNINNNMIFGIGDVNLAGVVTATNGFSSGDGTAVQIDVIGTTLTFNVVGIGSTTLTLS